jgi:G:T-mismatch repair DNA endonuclease (very short patch repair protein)
MGHPLTSPSEKSTRLASFIVAGQRHNKGAARTEIEEVVAEGLARLGCAFQRNVQLGRYNVDFVVGPDLIIGCFGDFWHCSPQLYRPSDFNPSLKMTAAEKWGRDLARIRSLAGLGHRVLILWEAEIRWDHDAIGARVAEFRRCRKDAQD